MTAMTSSTARLLTHLSNALPPPGNCPLPVPASVRSAPSRPRRRSAPACRRRGLEIQQRERRRIGLELRRELEEHFVFVHRRVDRRDPPRAVRVVERVLDLVRGDAERGGLVAIDLHVHLRAADLEVARQILEARHFAERLLQVARRVVQLLAIRRLHRVLIEALAYLSPDPHRRRLLHVDLDARHLRQLRPQLLDDLPSELPAIAPRLQLHDDLPQFGSPPPRGRAPPPPTPS